MDVRTRLKHFNPYFAFMRVLFRRYGIFLLFGLVLIAFQGFSGYYILNYGLDDKVSTKMPKLQRNIDDSFSSNSYLKHLKIGNFLEISEDKILSTPKDDKKSRSNHTNFQGDAHNKGPPRSSTMDLNINATCHIKSKEAISAIHRAKTQDCKKLIVNITCQIEEGVFYPKRLKSNCPSNGSIRGKFMGCFIDDRNDRILNGYSGTLKHNSPSICLDLCYQRGYHYSGVEYGKECFCGNDDPPTKMRVSDSECDMKCSGNLTKHTCGGFLRISIVQTGLSKLRPLPLRESSEANGNSVRIAFILTLNGRALRQVYRLIKALYHEQHYFFIHVDSRQEYLYRELLKLEDRFPNIILSRHRLSSIWGGASLLTVLLHCMKELLSMTSWKWDFVINLSESDFPIKSNSKLVQFLTANRERNFLKSHGDSTNKFLQKQGLDRTFLECETHMWRIGDRKLPLGIRVDGGSDWICLNRNFVDYVIHSNDELVTGLKKVFSYTLLPAESFFHTVLRNSKHCQTFCDNNLHMTNWKRKLGCHCQYRNIVDWCGCSPNDFTLNDWKKLETSPRKNLFFARKFEPSVNLAVINKLEQWIYGSYNLTTPGLSSYWENRFHSDDLSTTNSDLDLTLHYAAIRFSLAQVAHSLPMVEGAHSLPSVDHAVECNLVPVFIHQVHSFHVEDEPQGLLVEFFVRNANSEDDSKFAIEVWIQQKIDKKLPIEFNNSIKLLNVEVNSNFDLKEQMFRNFGGALGIDSEITVATWWDVPKVSELTKPNSKEKKGAYLHPQLVIIDPNGSVVSEALIKVDADTPVVSHIFVDIPKPLQPGHWKARVIVEGTLYIYIDFPVIPLQFKDGKQILAKDIRNLLSGSSNSDQTGLKSFYGHLLSNWELPVESSFSHRLTKWIDEIVGKSYTINGVCQVSPSTASPCMSSDIPVCSKSHWSSYSPDPKSQLENIDPLTGYMKRPFLISKRTVL